MFIRSFIPLQNSNWPTLKTKKSEASASSSSYVECVFDTTDCSCVTFGIYDSNNNVYFSMCTLPYYVYATNSSFYVEFGDITAAFQRVSDSKIKMMISNTKYLTVAFAIK